MSLGEDSYSSLRRSRRQADHRFGTRWLWALAEATKPGTAPLDPWGRPYVVNVISGFYNHATNYKRIFVMSAGPNGVFDTSYLATATTDIAGDDIGMLLAEKQ